MNFTFDESVTDCPVKSPCKDCTKRNAECHIKGNCKAYDKYKFICETYKRKRNRDKENEAFYIQYQEKGIRLSRKVAHRYKQ